jgi:hypothetical protein
MIVIKLQIKITCRVVKSKKAYVLRASRPIRLTLTRSVRTHNFLL